MNWNPRSVPIPENCRVLIYSPEYGEKDAMRYRIVDSQFCRVMTDYTHWAHLEPPVEN